MKYTVFFGFVAGMIATVIGASAPSGLESWKYQGCYTEVGRSLTGASYSNHTNMTIETCISFCNNAGFEYAGTEYSYECFCSNEILSGVNKTSDSECNMPCTGDSKQACGGSHRLSLFKNE